METMLRNIHLWKNTDQVSQELNLFPGTERLRCAELCFWKYDSSSLEVMIQLLFLSKKAKKKEKKGEK